MKHFSTSVSIAAATVALICATVPATPASAQDPLRVIRHAPNDSGTAAAIITITFNRPVGADLEALLPPDSAVTISPHIAGTLQWRDPASIRFVPSLPFTPGTFVRVTVDTALLASRGARTAAPYTFQIRFPGPTPLAIVDHIPPGHRSSQVGPNPIFQVLYSAQPHPDSLATAARIEFPNACGGTVPLRPLLVRPITRNEESTFRLAGGADRDTVGDRFRSVVAFGTPYPLQEGCAGRLQLAVFDTTAPDARWTHRVNVAGPFIVQAVSQCTRYYHQWRTECTDDGISVNFSALVDNDQFARYVTLTPDSAARPAFQSARTAHLLAMQLTPRRSYTVTIDSALRDVYGRSLLGPRTFTIVAHDRVPGVWQQLGFSLFPRTSSVPTTQVRTVNVDSLLAEIIPIPDSLLPVAMSLPVSSRATLLWNLGLRFSDTVTRVIPIHAEFNEETVTEIELPELASPIDGHRYRAVRFSVRAASVAPDSVQRSNPLPPGSELPAVTTYACTGRECARDLGLLAQVSALTAHSKLFADSGAVFVTSTDGNPIANASISLIDGERRTLATGTTGSDGLATLTPRRQTAATALSPDAPFRHPDLDRLRILQVNTADDELFVPVSRGVATTLASYISPSIPGGPFSVGYAIITSLHTDRDIFRPGEVVYLKSFTRRWSTLGAAAEPDSLLFTLVSRDTLAKVTGVSSAFGTYTDSIALPASAEPGYYTLTALVRVNGRWVFTGNTGIRISSFRTAEFQVAATLDTTAKFSGDTMRATVTGRYTFGAAMGGAPVQWVFSLSDALYIGNGIPGGARWEFGELERGFRGNEPRPELQRGEGVLNSDGELTVELPTTGLYSPTPARLHFAAAVKDVSEQVISTTSQSLIYLSNLYLGMRGSWSTSACTVETPTSVAVIALRPTGERVVGLPIRATVAYRRQEFGAPDGTPTGELRTERDTVMTAVVRSSSDSVEVQFTPARRGEYEIRFEATDGDGSVARSSSVIFCRNATAPPPPGVNGVRLSVTVDEGDTVRFLPGDSATVSFESPFSSANAWITLEGEGVRSQRVVHVDSGVHTFRVAITEEFAPNIWVGVTLIPRASAVTHRADSLAQTIRVGYTQLRVTAPRVALKVAIAEPHSPAIPGSSFPVTVQVAYPDGAAARAEVALWAVDKGVLLLTDYQTPDLLQLLHRSTGVAPAVSTSYSLLPLFSSPARVFGGSNVEVATFSTAGARAAFSVAQGALGDTHLTAMVKSEEFSSVDAPAFAAQRLRHRFRSTAVFIGSALTDSAGRAVVQVQLPDNVTTFRIMATAITTGNSFGSAARELVVSQPLVLRPALPRFVRPGDVFRAAAAVNLDDDSASTAAPVRVRVNATASGVAFTGAQRTSVSVSSPAPGVAHFPVRVTSPGADSAVTVTFVAADATGVRRDAVAYTVPVRNNGAARAHTAIGSLRDTTTVYVELPRGTDTRRTTFTVGVASSPLPAMKSSLARLRAYPYQHTYHVLLTARALLTTYRTQSALGVAPSAGMDSATVYADLSAAVRQLERRQSHSGYFAYWPGLEYIIDPLMTADVGNFLLEARDAGVPVLPRAIADAGVALTRFLDFEVLSRDTVFGSPEQKLQAKRALLGDRAAAVAFLLRSGAAAEVHQRRLLSQRDEMAWEDVLVLAGAYALSSDGVEIARELVASSWDQVRVIGNRVELDDSLRSPSCHPSHIRPAARLFILTHELFPSHPLLGALAETIVRVGSAERFIAWNIVDYGAAIDALARFAVDQREWGSATIAVRNSAGRVVMRSAVSDLESGAVRTAIGDGGGVSGVPIQGHTVRSSDGGVRLELRFAVEGSGVAGGAVAPAAFAPLYFSVTVNEVAEERPVTPDISGMVVERWYERVGDGTPVTRVEVGDLVRVKVRVTVPADRSEVIVEDPLPAGLEIIDMSLRTTQGLEEFMEMGLGVPAFANIGRSGPIGQAVWYGRLGRAGWEPWEYSAQYDDRYIWFARKLWTGSYTASYIARATTSGTFLTVPARALEMYNPGTNGRSSGGTLTVGGGE